MSNGVARQKRLVKPDELDDDIEVTAPSEYVYIPDKTWRERHKTWATKITDELADIVFAMAKDGIGLDTIAKFFGVQYRQVEMFKEPFEMGRADLQARIARKTVNGALASNSPVCWIWAGKVFNGYSESTTVQAEDNAGVNFAVNIIRGTQESTKSEETTDLEAADNTNHH